MGVPSSQGLAPDAPPLPSEWREGSGLAFALAERVHGRPSDPLLFALMHRHPLMHDGRRVDAAERARLATVLMAPERPASPVPMVEVQPDDETPTELEPRLKRRSRVADLVPAGKVTGWVPQWKREDPGAGSGRQAVGSGGAECAAAVVPQSPLQVASSSRVVPAGAADSPRALATEPVGSSGSASQAARKAGAPAVSPPSAGAPVVVARAALARQSAGTASHQGGKGARAARQRPAAAPASVPPSSPAAAERDAVPGKARPSIEHIVAVAERAAGIEPGALVPESRRPAVTEARQLALFLAETLLGWDYSRLGRFFGRDRASVRYAVGVVYERRRQDAAFARRLRKILAAARAEPRARRRKIAP